MQTPLPLKQKPIPSDPVEFESFALKLFDQIQTLETKVHLLEKARFGPSSERFSDPDQGSLFNEIESLSADDDGDSDSDEEIQIEPHTRKKRKKKIDLSEVALRETTVHEIPESERICSCCNEVMSEMGSDKVEKLKIIPAKLSVKEDIYKKYACKNSLCDCKPKQAPTAPAAVPRIKATNETLAYIATQKYQYGLPLYRLESFFSVLGVALSRSVMSQWMIKTAFALKPIYLTLEERLLDSNYVHIDETRVQVLNEKGRQATTQSFAWVRRTGDPNAPPITLFHYSPTRSAKVAEELLFGFNGFVQSDDYEGYACALNGNEKVSRLLCWDHARRYFWDAYKAIPSENRDQSTSGQILKLIKKLYKIERKAKEGDAAAALKLRLDKSVKTLEKIKNLMDEKLPTLSSISLTTKAIKYTLDNWELLKVYTTNPMLNISNCPAEQAIRPFVIGRKNWLFSCTPEGAEASMILYSIIITAKSNGLNPLTYLKDALDKLPFVENADDLDALLPLSKGG